MLWCINGVFSSVPPGSKGSASTGPMSAAVAGVPRLPPGRKPPGPPPGPPPPQVLALYGIPVRRPPGTDTGRTHTLLHRAGPGTCWSWYQLVPAGPVLKDRNPQSGACLWVHGLLCNECLLPGTPQ